MPYYEYYSYSYFFFLFFFLFFILILFSYPVYSQKEIVPILSDATYAIKNNIGTLKRDDVNKSTFTDLKISEDEGIEIESNSLSVSYSPFYEEARKNFIGFFNLNLVTSKKNTLAFRVIDRHSDNITDATTLRQYNYGWKTLHTLGSNEKNNYNVNIPFNLPRNKKRNSKITVQISAVSDEDLNLSSATIYYSSY